MRCRFEPEPQSSRPDEEYPPADQYRSVVRTPDDAADESPAAQMFHEDAEKVRVIGHHGRFWLFDTTPLYAAN